MPCCAVQTAVAVEAAPHQIRSRRPGEYGSRRSRPGGFGKHRPRVRLGEALALQELEEDLGVAARHVGIGLALGRLVAEVAEAIDHLLGRAATDAQLQPAAGDEIGRPGVLGHVERVLVAHVDDRGPHLDPLRPRTDRGEERERGAELRAKWWTRKYAPSAPSSSAATASSIDWSRASDPERTCEYGESDQWPNDRNPMRFIERRVSRQRPADAPLVAGPGVRLATLAVADPHRGRTSPSGPSRRRPTPQASAGLRLVSRL